MQSKLKQQVKEIFLAALDCPPSERALHLDRACGSDAGLRQEVDQLLAAHESTSPLDASPVEDVTFDDDLVFQPGDVVAERFEVVRLLGGGGMGEVYEVWDKALRERVALKTLRADWVRDPKTRRLFLREIRLGKKISHRNVCRIHDHALHRGPQSQVDVISMELLEGQTLSEHVGKARGLSADAALEVARQMAGGLDAAHAVGVAHLDLKPGNVMVIGADSENPRIVITDFGIARRIGGDSTFSDSVAPDIQLMGTPQYMAPEQLRGAEANSAADIYAFGIVLYELVTGERAFSARDARQALAERATGIPLLISRVLNKCNKNWTDAIEACLQEDPRARPSTAAEAVERIHGDKRNIDRGEPAKGKGTRPGLPRRVVAGACMIVVAVMLWLVLQSVVANPGDRQSVLIADFTNHSDEETLGPIARILLRLALEQSRYFDVFPHQRIHQTLALMRKERTAALTPAVAREIGLRENLSVLITGEILDLGETYQIVVRASDLKTDSTRAIVRASIAGSGQLPAAVDELTADLRRELGEGRAAVWLNSKPLERATTSSFNALQHLCLGLDHQAEAKMEDAMVFFKSAIESDPEFAMAHGHLSIVQAGVGAWKDALASADRAFALRDRVTKRERHFISANYHFLRGEFEDAADHFRSVTILNPADPSAYRHLAQSYRLMRDQRRAIEAAFQAVEVAPTPMNRAILVAFLVEADRTDDALEQVSLGRADRPGDNFWYWPEGLVWLAKGHPSRAQKAFFALEGHGGAVERSARLYLVQSFLLSGELNKAVDRLESDLAFDLKAGDRHQEALRRYWLARLYLLLDRRRSAMSHLQALTDTEAVPMTTGALRNAGILYAEMGRTAQARDVLQRIEKSRKMYPSRFARAIVAHLSGTIDWHAGAMERASEKLELAVALHGEPSMVWSLAQFFGSQGDTRRAAELYQSLLARKGELLHSEPLLLWPLAHLALAQNRAKTEEYSAALIHYDKFLELWEPAASDSSLVEQADAERVSLQNLLVNSDSVLK